MVDKLIQDIEHEISITKLKLERLENALSALQGYMDSTDTLNKVISGQLKTTGIESSSRITGIQIGKNPPVHFDKL